MFLYADLGYCGGTLINSRIILTAAHCFRAYAAARDGTIEASDLPKQVYIGGTSLKNPASFDVRKVVAGRIHPKYNDSNFVHDIALLLLERWDWESLHLEWKGAELSAAIADSAGMAQVRAFLSFFFACFLSGTGRCACCLQADFFAVNPAGGQPLPYFLLQ